MVDRIQPQLIRAIEKRKRLYLWTPADAITFVPRVLPTVYGDGRALFTIATINQRPAYWVIRACSTWGCGLDREDSSGPDSRRDDRPDHERSGGYIRSWSLRIFGHKPILAEEGSRSILSVRRMHRTLSIPMAGGRR